MAMAGQQKAARPKIATLPPRAHHWIFRVTYRREVAIELDHSPVR